MDFLVVDFDETTSDEMSFRCIILGECDYLTEGTGYNAARLLTVSTAHHRMGLAAACLPIGEDGAIVSIKYTLDQRKGALLIDRALRRFGGEYAIEGEAFGLLFGVFFDQVYLIVLGINLHDADAT